MEADNGPVRLHYERAGGGPPLLVISGTGGDLRRTPTILDSPLVGRFDVVAYDQRGNGRTTWPDGPLSMADYAADAMALLDHLGWEAPAVLGISFGGMVAQELAVSHPHRVGRLVLACTSAGGPGGSSYPLHELGSRPDGERLPALLALSDTRCDLDWQAEHPDETAGLLELLATAAGPTSPRQLQARRDHDTWSRLGRITAPTLVAAGRYDGIAPPANGEALAGAIPGARLELFEGGHGFLVQDPTAFDAVAGFLAG